MAKYSFLCSFWTPYKLGVDRDQCSCSCWDSVFKGKRSTRNVWFMSQIWYKRRCKTHWRIQDIQWMGWGGRRLSKGPNPSCFQISQNPMTSCEKTSPQLTFFTMAFWFLSITNFISIDHLLCFYFSLQVHTKSIRPGTNTSTLTAPGTPSWSTPSWWPQSPSPTKSLKI